jgi:hypothetical protein
MLTVLQGQHQPPLRNFLLLSSSSSSFHMVSSHGLLINLLSHTVPTQGTEKKKIHHSFSQISLLITHVNCQPLSHQVFLQTPSLILTISFLFTNNNKKKKQKQKKTKIYSLSGLLSNTSPSPLVCRLLQQKLQIKNPIPCQKLFASPANGVSIQKFIFDVLCFTFSVFFLHSMLFFFLWQQPTSFFLDLPSSHRTSELSSALPQSHLIISLSVSSLCLGFQQTTISLSLSFSTSQSLSLYFLCFALDLTVCIFKSIKRCYQFMKSTKMRLPP